MDKEIEWSKFRTGDRRTFEYVYNSCIDDMYAYGLKIDPDKELIKDSVQDVFIEIFEHRNEISKPQNIKFYFLKSLKHAIFRRKKKERKRAMLLERIKLGLVESPNFEDKLILSEMDEKKKHLVHEALQTLTPKQKEIMYLRFSAGLRYDEISEIMEIDRKSVKKQVYRAVKKLRNSKVFNDYREIILFYSTNASI